QSPPPTILSIFQSDIWIRKVRAVIGRQWRECRTRKLTRGESGRSGGLGQTIADGVSHKFRGFMNTQRLHNSGSMSANGIDAEIQMSGNFSVGLAFDNELENFKFASAKLAVGSGPTPGFNKRTHRENHFTRRHSTDGSNKLHVLDIFLKKSSRS